MSIYYLFLDELKPNDIYKHFCLGGCFIEDVLYRKTIIPEVNKIKENIFGNTTIVLHETKIASRKGDYKIFARKPDKEKEFWIAMKNLLTKHDIGTLCVGVDYNKYKKVYPTKGKIVNSEYYIALQIILENFVHFLDSVDGKGSVYIESREVVPDMELQQQYDTIRNQGTLFIPKEVFQKRLMTISFPMKSDNNIGIQLADFIPNPVARSFAGIKQKEFTLYDTIVSKSYDGNDSLCDRFGIKKVL